MQFMDARRGLIHDGRGNPAGQRPGYLYSDDEEAEQAVATAYTEYSQAIRERWRAGPGQRPSPKQAEPPPTFANPEAARAAAYAQYNRDIQERRRK
jgi:hypothetical protein